MSIGNQQLEVPYRYLLLILILNLVATSAIGSDLINESFKLQSFTNNYG